MRQNAASVAIAAPNPPPVPTVERSTARKLLTTGVLGVLVLSLALSASGLHGVLDTVAAIDPVWIAAALALELASEVAFVVVFELFFDRLDGRDARALAWTEL